MKDSQDLHDFASKILDDLDSKNLRRQIMNIETTDGVHAVLDGKELTLFCSNDYLGLSGDPRLAEASAKAAKQYGMGARASRLISGSSPIHGDLEAALSEFHHSESALVFASGFQANLSVVGSLVGKGDLVATDQLIHASLIDAVRLSGATCHIYPHNDIQALDKILAAQEFRSKLVITESVFSMDGDLSPLKIIFETCQKQGASLLVDEAHATGVWGKGKGRVVEEGLAGQKGIVRTGTLSKSLGSQGGYFLGPRSVVDLILNTGRAFIFTTGLSPALCGAALKALEIINEEPEKMKKLWGLTHELRTLLGSKDIEWAAGGPIIPYVLGSEKAALKASKELFEAGIYVPAIRPPTVPNGTCRLRITLSAVHSSDQVKKLAVVLGQGHKKTYE